MERSSLFPSSLLLSDEQAMWRVQTQDDPHAFAHLVARWEGPILRLCARMTGDVHCGEDLKQEAFARAFAHRKNFRPGTRFSTWLWRIAVNLCLNEQRRRRSRPEDSWDTLKETDLAVLDCTANGATPADHATAAEERELMRRALQRLPEPQRAVLVLRFCEGFKLREIAELLEVPEGTVCSRLAEGLARLSRLLKPKLFPASPEPGQQPKQLLTPGQPSPNHEPS